MTDNYYHDTLEILRDIISKITELNSKLDDLLEVNGLSDDEIDDAWEGDAD